MLIQTNCNKIKTMCDNLKIPCELMTASELQNVPDAPFIYMQGDAVTQLSDFAASTKGKMIFKMLGG